MKVHITVRTNKVGSDCVDEFELPDYLTPKEVETETLDSILRRVKNNEGYTGWQWNNSPVFYYSEPESERIALEDAMAWGKLEMQLNDLAEEARRSYFDVRPDSLACINFEDAKRELIQNPSD